MISLLLSRLSLSRLWRAPYRALQCPKDYYGVRMMTPNLIRTTHEQGARVDVWTIDKEADMRRLLGFGVDGIMTDRPDILARLLGEN